MDRKGTPVNLRRSRARRRGNALLESALVLWPMMLLMFGVIQVGFAIWSQSTLAYAVDTAARYATLHGARSSDPATADAIRQAVKDNALGMTATDITVVITWTPNNRPGSNVQVDATYPLPTLVSAVWPTPPT